MSNHKKKKTTRYQEQEEQRVATYQEQIKDIPPEKIAYVDECGIDTYLYREYGYASRGQQVFGRISGRRYQRCGIVDKSGANATDAVDIVGDALIRVSTQRSVLGAVQNRLEHTINNLDNVVENTTDAESSIRDTDMADEMVQYSNNNILLQAGQSMLAQANHHKTRIRLFLKACI